ncbi:MAG: DUF4367 domain-containing protein [Clostridiales bacterium]|nr:DUF4367 domain-containing protein [Clostridiales bacterium]
MSTYKSYMDRQHVSSDLHQRLLELERQPRTERKPIPWGRYVALAACLCVAVGIGWFVWPMLDAGGMDSGWAVSSDSASAETVEMTEDTATEETTEEAGDEVFWDGAESAAAEDDEAAADTAEKAAADSAEEETTVTETETEAETEAETEDEAWLIPGWLPDGYSLAETTVTENGYTLYWVDDDGGELTLTWHETAEDCPETALTEDQMAETDWTEAVREDGDGVSVLELVYGDGWLELTFTGDGETLWSVGSSLWP